MSLAPIATANQVLQPTGVSPCGFGPGLSTSVKRERPL